MGIEDLNLVYYNFHPYFKKFVYIYHSISIKIFLIQARSSISIMQKYFVHLFVRLGCYSSTLSTSSRQKLMNECMRDKGGCQNVFSL